MLFIPYILVPELASFYNSDRASKSYTYLITAVIIFFYPFVFLWLANLLNPPVPGPRCMTAEVCWIIGNMVFFLPVSLGMQWFSNLVFFRKSLVEIAPDTTGE